MRVSLLCLLVGVILFAAACSSTPQFGQETNAAEALHTCNEIMEKGHHDKASKCYESVRSRFAGEGISDEADLRLADISFERKEYLLAAEGYRSFAKLHPAHPKLPYVYYQAGLCYLRESPKAIDRDQQYLDESIGYLEIGVRYFPGSAYQDVTRDALKEARRRLAARELYVGKFYYKRKEFRSSITRFIKIIDQYEGLGHDEEAIYLMAKAYLELQERSKAFEVTALLKSRHPNSPYLDKLLGDLDID